MKLTPVRSIKEYDGPKSHRAILFKIQEDAKKENNVDLPFDYVEKVIRLFFSHTGIGYYFKHFKTFSIVGLGKWIINRKGLHAKRLADRRRIAGKRKTKRIYMRKFRKKVRKLKKIQKREALAASKRVSLK